MFPLSLLLMLVLLSMMCMMMSMMPREQVWAAFALGAKR
jgi:hypothetical protein